MKCASFEERLDELLDHRLPPDETGRAEAHLDACARCRDLLSRAQRAIEALHSLPRRETTERERTAILKAVGSHGSSHRAEPEGPVLARFRRHAASHGLASLVGAAAAVLLLWSIGWNPTSDALPAPQTQIVERVVEVPVFVEVPVVVDKLIAAPPVVIRERIEIERVIRTPAESPNGSPATRQPAAPLLAWRADELVAALNELGRGLQAVAQAYGSAPRRHLATRHPGPAARPAVPAGLLPAHGSR